MKVATATQMKARFDAYLKQTQTSPVIVTKRGKPVAMLVAMAGDVDVDDVAWSPRLQEILDAARRRIAAGEGIPHDEFWKQMAKHRSATKRARTRRKTAAVSKDSRHHGE